MCIRDSPYTEAEFRPAAPGAERERVEIRELRLPQQGVFQCQARMELSLIHILKLLTSWAESTGLTGHAAVNRLLDAAVLQPDISLSLIHI